MLKKNVAKVGEKFYKTFVRPAMINGFECRVLNKKEETQMKVTEMATQKLIGGMTNTGRM